MTPTCPFADALFQLIIKAAQLFQQTLVAAFQLEGAGGAAQDLQQFLAVEGLKDVAVYLAGVDGLDGVLEDRQAGHEQADGFGGMLPDPFEELDTGHVR